MSNRKEKKHMKECFNKRLDEYLAYPDDAILPFVECDRCSAYFDRHSAQVMNTYFKEEAK
jgi:hypothetical protein